MPAGYEEKRRPGVYPLCLRRPTRHRSTAVDSPEHPRPTGSPNSRAWPTLIALRPSEWFNPAIAPSAEALADVGLGAADVADASARLQRFAPLIARLFPETAASGGIIESDLVEVATFHDALRQHYAAELPGRLWLKRDSHLPISGSIKARGGIYEVLAHAERLALEHGLVGLDDDYSRLAEADCRAFFARHRIAVGSTGNLGLSIGIIGAALGFQASVHISADARQWKKDKLRAHGVTVVEYASDYSVAVEQGRREAAGDPTPISSTTKTPATCSSATPSPAERLRGQLDAAGIRVDSEHPLFVHLPCGVGGGPGGVAFGLKLAFGDAVHCLFAEPTHSPCMFLGVYTGRHEQVSVQDFGIDNRTAADGLAVGRPSGFVSRAMQRLLDGATTRWTTTSCSACSPCSSAARASAWNPRPWPARQASPGSPVSRRAIANAWG